MNFFHTLNLSSIKHFFKKCGISNPNIRFIQNRYKIYNTWTEEDLETLRNAVNKHGNKWKYISDNYFSSSRTQSAIHSKWIDMNRSSISRPSYYNKWTEEEDRILKYGIEKYGVGKWKEIEKLFDTKGYVQIVARWETISKGKRGLFTPIEDEKLLWLVKNNGRKWRLISDIIGRPYCRCRDRYEALISKPWTKEESEKLRESILKYKQDWRKIANEFPDRSLFSIKRHHMRNSSTNPNVKLGRWNDIEKHLFKKAFEEHGKRWVKISKIVGTRSPQQCNHFFIIHKEKFS